MKHEIKKFTELWDNAPSPICVREGPDHRYTYANKAYKDLIGKRDFLNQPFKQVMPELVNQGLEEILDKVYATGEAYQGQEISVVISKNNIPQKYYENIIFQPLTDEDNNVFGILVQIIDITKQVELRKDKEVLLEELHHRVKNNLALMVALHDLQANEITNEECLIPFRNTQKRIGTFAKVHELIFNQHDLKKIPVHKLIENLCNQNRNSNIKFILAKLADDLYVNINQAIPLGLISNEILSWFQSRSSNISEVSINSELVNFPEVGLIFNICCVDDKFDKKQVLWDNITFEGRLINILANQLKATVEVSYSGNNIILHIRFTKADISGSGADKFF